MYTYFCVWFSFQRRDIPVSVYFGHTFFTPHSFLIPYYSLLIHCLFLSFSSLFLTCLLPTPPVAFPLHPDMSLLSCPHLQAAAYLLGEIIKGSLPVLPSLFHQVRAHAFLSITLHGYSAHVGNGSASPGPPGASGFIAPRETLKEY